MRPVLLLVLSVSICCGAVFSIGTTDVSGKISQVTVFSDRALVEQTAQISVPAGENKVVITGLPPTADRMSIRVSAKGIQALILGGVEVVKVKYEDTVVQILKDSIQLMDDRLAEIKIEEDGLEIRKKFLESIASLGTPKPDKGQFTISANDLSATANFLKSQLADIASSKTILAKQKREIQKMRNELQERLNNILSGKGEKGFTVEVPFKNPAGGVAEFTIQYIVNGPRWLPQYDARYDEESGTVELAYYGTIVQSSGEDWQDSKIILSTTQPQLGIQPPTLDPWYLWVYTPRPPAPSGRGVMMEKATAMDMTLAPERAELQASYEETTPVMSGVSVVFHVPGKKTIPSDGQDHRVTIVQLSLGATKQFTTIPKLDEKVYLVAKVKNNSDYFLLQGEVAVFQGNSFIGTQRLHTPVAFDEEFTIALGPVQMIKVKRERIKQFQEATGIIGQNIRKQYGFVITLTNNSREEVSIEVLDQVPVSTDERIIVEDVKTQPPLKPEADTGKLAWQISLKPGESKKIEIMFAVKHPKDINIIGL